jgi:hypothetical protein
MEYRFSKKRVRGKDLRLAQKGDYDANLMLMASCLIDPATGDYMDKQAAFDLLDEMDVESQDAEADKFLASVEEAKRNAVPLVSGGR